MKTEDENLKIQQALAQFLRESLSAGGIFALRFPPKPVRRTTDDGQSLH